MHTCALEAYQKKNSTNAKDAVLAALEILSFTKGVEKNRPD